MTLDLTPADATVILSALATEHARLVDLARAAGGNAGLQAIALRKEGAVAQLRARLRDLTRRGTASRRTRRVGAKFGREKLA